MSSIPHLVGMVHLLPLPGSPGYSGSMKEIVETAVADAATLTRAGFPALMIENFGDVPFFGETVPPETVSAMTLAVDAIANQVDVPFGVNVLRNDVMSGLGIAAATGARFVRVNVLTGIMFTDQGPLVGRAAEALRKRALLGAEAEIWADVMVKHATPPPGSGIEQAAADISERGLADAVIVSGTGTGAPPDLGDLARVRKVIPEETRLVVGSGASISNLGDIAELADTVIVGSAVKRDGEARNRVDPDRAARMVQAAARNELL